VAVEAVLGMIIALAINSNFKGRPGMLYVVLSMTMFPQIAVLGGLFQIVTSLGLYNRLLALMSTDLISPCPSPSGC
jgi:trehalose/maltose transport system permease protein